MNFKLSVAFLAVAALMASCAVKIDTSMSYVPEEGGTTFAKITNEENEQLIVPLIGYDGSRLHISPSPRTASVWPTRLRTTVAATSSSSN